MTFVEEHRDRYAVALLLRVVGVSESTYYDGLAQVQQPCDRDEVDRALLSNIHDIWTASGHTYGADRVHQQLRRDGICVGRKRVERLMAAQDWRGALTTRVRTPPCAGPRRVHHRPRQRQRPGTRHPRLPRGPPAVPRRTPPRPGQELDNRAAGQTLTP